MVADSGVLARGSVMAPGGIDHPTMPVRRPAVRQLLTRSILFWSAAVRPFQA